MTERLRFAPSPTGNVHIGNIRAAIFNWLHARHAGGRFLLRIEDTDLERSTRDAIDKLLEVMAWLGLDYDDAPLYQSSQRAVHLQAAERLLAAGAAYRHAKGGEGEAVLFRIPWDAPGMPGLSVVGPAELEAHPEQPLVLNQCGVSFAQPSAKGKPMPRAAGLAGFRDLEVFDADGQCRCRLNEVVGELLAGRREVVVERPARLRFTRRTIAYRDLVKGELAKPLDNLQDFVIVRSDGSPVFHLGNVVDDITQGITLIVRGDDHVENTYRHVFLFHALGAPPPRYAHLPMIVNAQGKPYSKRDGDAYVGDFRDKGFLPQALFNYLALLGWSPGDDREKMTRADLVAAFSLDRVKSSCAQMDLRKLTDLNGQYIAELPPAEFAATARAWVERLPWGGSLDAALFARVCTLMQIRTKTFQGVADWVYFFVDVPPYDEKACAKFLRDDVVQRALEHFTTALRALPAPDAAAVEAAVHAATTAVGLPQGKLNQPLRVAVTGTTIGAGIYETVELLGRERTLRRLEHARALPCCQTPAP